MVGVRLSVALLPPTQVLELPLSVATVQELVLKSWSLGLLSMLDPIFCNVMIGKLLCATNLYHTSAELALPQKALMPVVRVALFEPTLSDPETLLQVPAADVSNVALLQSSLAGCAKDARLK